MCYGVTGTNARGELFNQNATDKTSGRFALKAVQFAGEGSPDPIAALWVAGEKQPVGNLAFHADSPKSGSKRVAASTGVAPSAIACFQACPCSQ